MIRIKTIFAAIACVAATATAQSVDPIVSHINTSVRPQDDFFEYANGTWFRQNPIPATEKDNGIFTVIQDTIDDQIRRICQEASERKQLRGSARQKIGDFYASYMDSIGRNKRGISELQGDIRRIRSVKDVNALIRMLAYVTRVSSSALFSFGVWQDQQQSDKYAFYLNQGGLSLPDRRYYVENDEATQRIRQRFVEYATIVFKRAGFVEEEARKAAEKLLSIETELAQHSRKREDTRDPLTNFNKMSATAFEKLAPHLSLSLLTKTLGLKDVDTVVVGQPEFFTHLDGMLLRISMTDWNNYLLFHYVNGLASSLDDALFQAQFDFYSKTLRGIEQPRSRWRRAVTSTDHALGDLVGQVYVQDFLPKGTKEKFLEIGNAVKSELATRIRNLSWMSEETKLKALDKLNAVVMKLGYPDKWKDMSQVEISRKSYVRNVMNVNIWEMQRHLSHYGKKVDRTEWDMEPQTYNAYYNPSNNEIVIPGCNIFVPGFTGMPDDAILYAIVGGTFGHEVTHGFDDQGCLYDKDGNLQNWWAEADKKQFDARTAQIVKQFNEYEVASGLHINGSLTQGENIADLGGVIVALEAFKKAPQYQTGEQIGGFTPLQRFFLGYAQAWMLQMRPEALATQVKSNEHAPAKWRVLGPLSNIQEFYDAFHVKPGDKMYRADKVQIW